MTMPHDSTAAEAEGYSPIHVHIASAEPGTLSKAPAPASKKRRHVVYKTLTLTSSTPVDQLCGQEENRLYVLAQAGGNNVVLAADKGTAQNAGNTAAGQLYPQGAILPAGNTVPTQIPGTGQIWAAAAAYPAQVSAIVVYEAS